MDVLAAAGLVNHFGRVQENDKIVVRPILLRKGTTTLALYGLANVRDERLFRTFQIGNVNFVKPQAGEDNCFNLLAVHQNHVARTATSYLPETFLPDFLDFVVWGHEHDCIAEPIKNPHTGFYVLQPGSSVATSLIEGEAIPKYVFILSIKGKQYSLEKVRLMTIRPFIIDSVSLQEDTDFKTGASERPAIVEWLTQKIEEMIERANQEWRERPGNEDESIEPPLPLIRLKVDYSGGYEMENPRRFSNKFIHRVANVNDVVTFHRKRTQSAATKNSTLKGSLKPDLQTERLDKLKIQSLVESYLEQEDGLQILPENGLGDAIKNFIEKDDRDALKNFVKNSLAIQLDSLMDIDNLDEDNLFEEITKSKQSFAKSNTKKSTGIVDSDAGEQVQKKTGKVPRDRKPAASKATKVNAPARSSKPTRKAKDSEDEEEEEEEEMLYASENEEEARPTLKSRTAKSTGRTTKSRGRASAKIQKPKQPVHDNDSDEDSDKILEEEVLVREPNNAELSDTRPILGRSNNKNTTQTTALPKYTIAMPTRRNMIPNTVENNITTANNKAPNGISRPAKNGDDGSKHMGYDSRIQARESQPPVPAKRKHEENARKWNQNNDDDLLFDDDDGFS